ncbi:MAG: glycoside hydrolase family 32 protein [Microbacterium sp.]
MSGPIATASLRELALADRLRPSSHFTAPAGWMNDPNGVAQRAGVYHLFYQYNPLAAEHRSIHWGHAISRDLVHWQDRPIALSPATGAPDADGCWSGVLVDDGGRPVIVYSGHSDAAPTQTACLAYGDDSLDTWTREPSNPVISGPPAGSDVTAFRDHCVWRENGAWRQLIGSGRRGVGGCAFLYESDDLVTWRELGPLAVGDASTLPQQDSAWTGTMWECVDFFRVSADGSSAPPDAASGDDHLLLFSAWHEGKTLHPLVARGRYRGDRFEIDAYQRLDLGGRHAYAPQSFADESGRRVLWAWMQEARDAEAQRRAGWSGAMILPRRLWLDEAGVVRQEPVAEVELLRRDPLAWQSQGAVQRAVGVQADVQFTAALPGGAAVRVALFATDDGAEQTVLTISRSERGVDVVLDRSLSSLGDGLDLSSHRGDAPSAEERVQVRILLDRSSVEVFVDGIALTSRVYPTRADAIGIRVESRRGASVGALRGWRLADAEQEARMIGSDDEGEDDDERGF